MKPGMQNPMAGNPPTEQATDQAGRMMFRVTPRELTPETAECADVLGLLLKFALVAACFFVLSSWNDPEFPRVTAAIGTVALGYLAIRWRQLCHTTTEIELRMDSIRVKRLFVWQSYDRSLDHRFSLLQHDDTENERRRHDLAVRKAAAEGRVVQKTVYYGDSYHVVLSYAGHRVDLLTVYGLPQAAAVVARLQYCARLLDQEAKRSNGGEAPHAGDEWAEAPGGLHDD
ncbi:hypothetical protein [Pseudomonas putida]|uniref:hypothetical protein n=1 Tax=Pseudomonas putida TaxID=303 RepID=UPI002363C020|nr:hypothetical protein [Pseudomonas putida]MDD2003617.1 hypothetical protein [Pseudomonas putida]